MESLRIAFVSSHHPAEQAMGLAHIVSALSRCMAKDGHAVRVYYPTYGATGAGQVATRGSHDRVETVGVPTPRESFWPFGPETHFSRRVARLLESDLDVVVVNNEQGGAGVVRQALRMDRAPGGGHPLAVDVLHGLGLRFLEVGRATRPKTFRTYYAGFWADRFFLRRLEGGGAREVEVCIACSKAVKEDLRSVYHVDPRRIHVIYNGVTPRQPRTREEYERARQRLGIPQGTRVLSFLGRDPYRKGLDIARHTVTRLRKEGIPLLLLNAGNDEASEEGVRTLGSVSEADRAALMDACDAFFLPTRYEGFPAVVQEAAARAIPVVTSGEANVELGTPGRDFIEVRPNTVDAHSAALLEALKDPSELWNMGERGRKSLGTRTYEAQAEEYLSLFRLGLSSTS